MIRRKLSYLLLIIATSCLAAQAPQQTPPAPAAAPAAQAPPATAATGSDLVVLRVAGEPITERQVMAAIAMLAQQKQSPAETPQERNASLFRGAVNNILIEKLLNKEASRLNLSLDQEKVEQQWQQMAKSFPSQADFQKALAAQGFTEAQLRNNIEASVRIQQVLDLATKDVPPATDAEAQKFYDDNPQKMSRPERVHAAHILLLVDKNSTPEQKAEIRKKLEGIRAEIESKSIIFSDAAVKYSQDSGNAKQGGDLQYFARGQMVPPFEEAAFSAEPGSLSQVVETEFGFHLIHVIDKRAAGKIPFEEAKADIKEMLDASSQRRVVQQYLKDLKAKSTIENFMTAEEFIKRHMASR